MPPILPRLPAVSRGTQIAQDFGTTSPILTSPQTAPVTPSGAALSQPAAQPSIEDILGAPATPGAQITQGRRQPVQGEKPLIDFNENPLGAIGLVLQETARGARGQPSLVEEMKRGRRQREALDIKRLTVGADIMSQAITLAKELPDDQFQSVAGGLADALDNLGGDGDSIRNLKGLSRVNLDALSEALPTLSDPIVAAIVAGMGFASQEKVVEFMSSKAAEPIIQSSHARNGPVALAKAKQIVADAGSIEGAGDFLADGVITEGEFKLINKLARDPLTTAEMGALLADDGALLADAGIRTAKLSTKLAETEAVERVKQQFKDNRGVLQKEAEFLASVTGDDVGEIAKRLSRDTAKDKLNRVRDTETGKPAFATDSEIAADPDRYEPLVVGRTAEDRAAERDDEPVPAVIAAVVPELATGATVGDARAEGVSVPDDTTVRKLQETFATTKGAIRRSTETIEKVRGRPDLLSSPGAVQRLINSLASQLEGFKTAAGGLAEVPSIRSDDPEIERERAALRDRGVESAEAQSLILDMAYLAAIARGQDGRALSDKDVERFEKIVGGGNADPIALENVMTSLMDDIEQRAYDQFESATGRRPSALFEDLKPSPRDDSGGKLDDAERRRLEALRRKQGG